VRAPETRLVVWVDGDDREAALAGAVDLDVARHTVHS
jgi:hypothetical protein